MLSTILNRWRKFRSTSRPATAAVPLRLEALEDRRVPTTTGWTTGVPPRQMTFTSLLRQDLDPATAARTVDHLGVRDNVTRAVTFVAPTSGPYQISTARDPAAQHGLDTVLGVYDNQGHRLAFNNNSGGTRYSTLTVNLQAGVPYRVGVGRFVGAGRPTDHLTRFCRLTIDGPDAAPVVSLGQQLVDWARARLGQQVGAGECADLVDQDLQANGARTFSDLGPTGADADYVWGSLVVTFHPGDPLTALDQVQPGDIIQFRDVHLQGAHFQMDAPHHTALVEANQGGGQLAVLEQNSNQRRFVTEGTYAFADMTQGTIWIYRPVAR